MFLLIFLQLCGELQTTRNYAALLPKVIQLMAHNDVGVKRICYASYAKHCHKVSNRQITMPIWGILQRTQGLTADGLKQEGYATMLLLKHVYYLDTSYDSATSIPHFLVLECSMKAMIFIYCMHITSDCGWLCSRTCNVELQMPECQKWQDIRILEIVMYSWWRIDVNEW